MSLCKPSEPFLEKLQQRYAKAKKKERSRILDEFIATTGYHRKYAIALLRDNLHHRDRTKPIRRPRACYYTAEDKRAVLWMVELFDFIGSKRLRVAMDTELPHLREKRHLQVSNTCYQHLLEVSPATMDRFRHAVRRSFPRHRGGTKPGTLLKSQIPIRTFAEWDDKRPGFVETDLVQHDGGNPRGFYACTLTVTDVCTGWTEMRAVRTKAQKFVFAALKHIRATLPFALRGIDSDNGAEFINDQLLRYCTYEQLTFTRGRVGRKNDNPFVESKNWSVIRRLIGYSRYDTQRQVDQLNALYNVYRLYVNHFLPVTKMVERVPEGHHTKKIYDMPKTPYQRVLDSPQVSEVEKVKLIAIHVQLDVVKLKRQIDQMMDALLPSTVG